MYYYETFGEDTLYLEEIAFGRGYSVNEVKEHCNLHFRDRFRFKEERLNNKLLEDETNVSNRYSKELIEYPKLKKNFEKIASKIQKN